MRNTRQVVSFSNGRFIVCDERTYPVIAARDEEDGDWKTAMARGYKGIKKGQEAVLHKVWGNLYGQWAQIELDGRKFDVRPSALTFVQSPAQDSSVPSQDVSDAPEVAAWYCSGPCYIDYMSTSKESVQRYIDNKTKGMGVGCSPSLYPTGPYPFYTYDTVHDLEVELARARAERDAARELQHNASELARAEAQVVGGKIANGHHCGLPEYLCNHPSHTTPPGESD